MVKAQSEGHGRAIAVLIIICGTALVLLGAVYYVARQVLE
jgi:hypothetical protein